MMECPFIELGCTVTSISTSTGYTNHLSQNTEQHLQMVMNLHKKSQGNNYSSKIIEDKMTSPLQKLSKVNQEVEFLDGMLEKWELNELPALECIKTVLQSPHLWIKKLGDKYAFRMSNFSQKNQNKSKWLSPPFLVAEGYKMCICVYSNGIKSGADTHISVSLLLLFDDQLEWPISLPPYLGIRVELMNEMVTDSEENDNPLEEEEDEEKDINLTWKPKQDLPQKSTCPTTKNAAAEEANMIYTAENDQPEGITLTISERFAPLSLMEHYAEEYNSLVFRVSLCLV